MIRDAKTVDQEIATYDVEPVHVDQDQTRDSGLLALLTRFLESGNVLLVQGSPGAGKTTLALELLKRMAGARIGPHSVPPNRLYVSSRVSPTKLRKHFPWINEVVDSGSGKQAGVGLTNGVNEFRLSQADSILSKVLTLKQSMQRSLIVIDSWEGALRNTTEDARRMLESAILSNPDESKMSVVLVSESESIHDLAHLVDGVVTLSSLELEGRRIRNLSVNKLRGLRVQKNQGLFTLDKGRFSFLPDDEPVDGSSTKAKVPEPIHHSQTSFSTGNTDLDEMLKGGVKRGSSLLLDLDSGVSPTEMRLLLRIICTNFVNQGGGCFIIPSGTISSENVAEALTPCIGEKALEDRVRITEFNTTAPPRKWRLPLKGELDTDIATFGACWKELATVSRDVVLASDFDTIVGVYGEDLVVPGLNEIAARIRDSAALSIGVASRPTKLREDFLRVADYHLRMQNLNGTLLIYGVKPFTNVHGIDFSFRRGFPSLKLTEIV